MTKNRMTNKILLSAAVAVTATALTIAFAGSAFARDQIRIVGSSTVYPFATVVAERFGDQGNKTPIIESTGTGGGFKLFCSGVGEKYPDFSNASRQVKDSEIKRCAENGIKDIVEINIGYDGIILANSVDSTRYELTKLRMRWDAYSLKYIAENKPTGVAIHMAMKVMSMVPSSNGTAPKLPELPA